MSRKCACCLVSELYRPGEWGLGWFRPARLQGGAKPLPIHGDICGDCLARLDVQHNSPSINESRSISVSGNSRSGLGEPTL